MTRDEATRIAALAYNTFPTWAGDLATPKNVWTFGRNNVIGAMERYAAYALHDEADCPHEQVVEAINIHVG